MALSLVTKTLKDGNGTTFTGQFATDGTNVWPVSVITDSNGNIITDASGLPITAASLPLPSGAATSTNQPALNGDGGSLAHVTNFPATQPVSGTVTANAGTNLNTSALALETGGNLATIAGLSLAQGSTTTGQKGALELGAVTTSAPSYTTGQTSPLSLDTSGNLRVVTSGGGSNGFVVQGSTTSGESGPLIQGAVTTSAPSYTTAQTSPLSLTTAGALRTDASATTQPVSGTVTANAGTGTFTTNPSQIAGSGIATAAAGVQKVGIVGNAGAAMDAAGQNATSPANELLVAGQFNTTPTTITSGNVSPLQLDNAGNLLVNVKTGGGSGGTSSSFSSTFPSTGTAAGAEYLSAAPTLTNGQMVALQTDINGNLKINVQTSPQSVGCANVNFGQASLSTTAAQIVAARTGQPGTGRVSVGILNTLPYTVYLGTTSGVTTGNGFPLPAGQGTVLNTTSVIFGILASGSGSVGFTETY